VFIDCLIKPHGTHIEMWKDQAEGDNVVNSNQMCISFSQLRSSTFQFSIVLLKIHNKTNVSTLKILAHREKETERQK